MNDALMARFIQEARELLQAAAAGLLVLERNPADGAAINEVFRAVHTLKGSSGLFDVPALTRLVHAGEDLLSAVRIGEFALQSDIVDQLLDSFDQVGIFIEQLENDGRLAADADRVAAHGAALLRAHLGEGTVAVAAPDAALAVAPDDWLGEVDAAALAAARARAADGNSVLVVRYEPDAGCFYSGTDPVASIQELPDIFGLAIVPREPWVAGADFDPYHCNLRLTALTGATRETIEQTMAYELDQIEIRALAAASDQAPPVAAAPAPHAVETATEALPPVAHVLATQSRILRRTGYDPARLPSTATIVTNVLHSLGRGALVADWQAALAQAHRTTDVAPLLAFLATLDAPAAATPSPVAEAVEVEVPLPVDVRLPAAPNGAASDAARAAARTLKVDQGKIDLLMTLIGELVVSKNALPFLAKRAEEIHGSRDMAREIKEQYAIIDRLTQEMQGAIMQVRMLPVAEIFDRFPRLIRDIARRLDKQVDLAIEGEDTAADKTIIEALGDPLLHIVRNSLDHGIERPQARIAAGKPAAATVRLRAFQDTDSVVIEVSDDGRGIDPAAIRDAAVAKAVVTREEADRLSDQEAVNLIYRPGFSTAAEVSDLSGRGVGMDVVLSTVQKLGGRVAVTSQLGLGTTTRLTMPLSMAVTRVMVVDIGDSLYGIPMDVVVQTVRLAPDAIRRIKQEEVFVLRDEVVPLVRMAHRLDVAAANRRSADDRGEAVLVCRFDNRTVGLVIDDFREGMDVILKPMDGILAGVPGYCGTTLLGDGRVLLILDLKEML
ncbi:chemotaxis protein CheW [Sphingomonas melonis]|uniref:Chemotaxis protein CheA n=1 Tax=Sphingomonas melonis TaxID=152682 RepID=A0A7Y9K3Q1_9SPHN|nr:chemotaxis protein CheA [Sphingomonas melonis]NYD92117.1 two-component system chemotaxis sensor kinase CheA [Sphingomonas melonis]